MKKYVQSIITALMMIFLMVGLYDCGKDGTGSRVFSSPTTLPGMQV